MLVLAEALRHRSELFERLIHAVGGREHIILNGFRHFGGKIRLRLKPCKNSVEFPDSRLGIIVPSQEAVRKRGQLTAACRRVNNFFAHLPHRLSVAAR